MPEKPPQNLENIEKTKSLESELSPEVLEKVMAKVQDITAPETPYTWVSPHALKRILEEGILSRDQYTSNSKDWTESVRKTRKNIQAEGKYRLFGDVETLHVFINIVGRRGLSDGKPITIRDGFLQREEKLSLLLDLSGYKEIPPYSFRFEKTPPRPKTFRAIQFNQEDYWAQVFGHRSREEYLKITWEELRQKLPKLFDESGKPKIMTSLHGFAVSYNIPSKFLQGVVLGERVSLRTSLSDMLEMFRKTNKPAVLLPFYNYNGDLLWPKKMSYEEVKKFVEERDKNKKEK